MVDVALERCLLQLELASVFGQLVGKALLAHLGGLDHCHPGDAKAAGQYLVALVLFDQVGLAGQGALVDLQLAIIHQRTVDRHLVARLDDQQVAQHEF